VAERPAVICIVDDNLACRTALGRLLRAEHYQPRLYGSAEEIIGDASADTMPGCLIVDLTMPVGMGGLELLERLAAAGRQRPTIVLTACSEPEKAFRAGRLGVCEFLRKPVNDTELLRAIANAIAPLRSGKAAAARRQKARQLIVKLSPRERQTLALLKEMRSRKKVAIEMGVDLSTVKYFCNNIFRKLGVHSLEAALEIWDAVTSDT
jgi:two-component system, LuxR family, response regulator FixJ